MCLQEGSSQQQSASVPLCPTYCSWNSLCMAEWSAALISQNMHCIALQWTSVSLLDHLASEPSSHTWGVFHFLEAYLPLSKQKTPDTHSPSFLSLKQGLLTCLLQLDIHPRLDSEMCGLKRLSRWGPHADRRLQQWQMLQRPELGSCVPGSSGANRGMLLSLGPSPWPIMQALKYPSLLIVKINFYRRIVVLRCSVGFCCTAKWISYTYTY